MEREKDEGRGRTNERSNEKLFINEGNGISTIYILFYFLIQPSGKKQQKTIENRIIINSKKVIIY